MDALAASGMKFTDAHTSSAVCTPTRYGILTGRYNWRSPLKSAVVGGDSKSTHTRRPGLPSPKCSRITDITLHL